MSTNYWKTKSAADQFEIYWGSRRSSLERRWGIVSNLQLEPPKLLLDVGCGIGNLITFTSLATKENYLGIDISPPMVERARALHPGYNFEVADPMKCNSISDLVVAHGFLLHQHDLFLKLHKLVQLTGSHLIFDLLVAKEGYSRRSQEGYWTRVLGEEEYGFMKEGLEKEFNLKEVKFEQWSWPLSLVGKSILHTEYYLSCRRVSNESPSLGLQ
jgi:SAM-dependent methyltransferase